MVIEYIVNVPHLEIKHNTPTRAEIPYSGTDSGFQNSTKYDQDGLRPKNIG